MAVRPATQHAASAPAQPSQGADPGNRGRWWIEGLDAWRALAIIAVLIFHLRPQTLPGGFIGVDVFFVISGFLITTLLLREFAKNGRVDLPNFWVRRARRLLPALFTVVITSTIVAFFAGGDLLVGIGRHVVGALTFSNNWVEIAYGSDYFEASTPNLFMNFWSLAVEEQFYLLWPILTILLLVFVARNKHRVAILLGGAVVSAVSMGLLYSPDAITRVYYGTDTHGFGLLIGAALAFAMAAPEFTFFDSRLWQRLRVPLAVGGFGVVIILMMTVEGESAFPYRGGLVIASIATAAMVSSLPGEANRLTPILTWSPIEWVGLRSYGIYMWHWPAILIVNAAWPATTPDSFSWWVSRLVALGATLSLAALSFTHIENPIRQHGFKKVGVSVVGWFRRIPPRGRTITTVFAASATALFAIAVLSAPGESTLERSMREAEQFVNAAPASGPGGPGAGAVTTGEEADDSQAAPEEVEEPEPEETPEEQAEPEPLAPISVTPKEIYTVGDSMLYVAAPGLSDALPGVKINAESNRQWPAVRSALTQMVDSGQVGEIVVIAAGTNAGAREVDIVRETVEMLGPERRIVLVNIYSNSTFVAATNENYALVAQEYPNVAVADWNRAVKDNPGNLQPDGIHPNFDGMHLWSGTVISALEELLVEVDLPEAAD